MKPLAEQLAQLAQRREKSTSPWLTRVLPVFVFFFFFPGLFFAAPLWWLDGLNQRFGSDSLFAAPLVHGLAAVMILVGVFFLVWTIKAQRTLGKGTPMPLEATQRLVTAPPYAYTRNPLAFGLLNLYFGLALWLRSPVSLAVVTLFALVILTYIKRVEEAELALRYGPAYEAYKQQTPFLLPRFKHR